MPDTDVQPEARAAQLDHRALMKKVERTVEAIEAAGDVGATIRSAIETVIHEMHDDLGIWGGRLYRREGRNYVLQATFGGAKPLPPGLKVPRTYPPLELCCLRGTVYIDAEDPTVDAALERELGVREFACVELGDEEYILAFNVSPDADADDIVFSLGILRHSLNQKIRQRKMEAIFHEASRIQRSILPRRAPRFGTFDIWAKSVPLESVGGDYHDYLPLSDKILGITIGDVTGHGLPAALQVRDLYTGLRMGMARDFKIVRTIEHLNKIIHRSTLTSRFVSLFYGELESNGNFLYVNAGHNHPFHVTAAGECRPMVSGGPVLGPLADATYERGFLQLAPGDMVLLYTDGIVETRGWPETADHSITSAMEEYGTRRLLDVALAHRGGKAQDVVEAIFTDVERFSGGRPAVDDRTVVVVTYPAG